MHEPNLEQVSAPPPEVDSGAAEAPVLPPESNSSEDVPGAEPEGTEDTVTSISSNTHKIFTSSRELKAIMDAQPLKPRGRNAASNRLLANLAKITLLLVIGSVGIIVSEIGLRSTRNYGLSNDASARPAEPSPAQSRALRESGCAESIGLRALDAHDEEAEAKLSRNMWAQKRHARASVTRLLVSQLQEADSLMLSNNFDGAIRIYSDLLNQQPANTRLRTLLSRAQMTAGKEHDARVTLLQGRHCAKKNEIEAMDRALQSIESSEDRADADDSGS